MTMHQEGLFQNKAEYDLESILSMSFTRFASSNLALEVESSVLGETVWFISDRIYAAEIAKEIPGVVTYGPGELSRIVNARPGGKDLRRIHEAKAVFGGRVTETKLKEF